MTPAQIVTRTEAWLIKRGMPRLVRGYAGRTDPRPFTAPGLALLNVAVLGVARALPQSGILPMLRASVRQLWQQFRASVGVFAPALPLLMISTTFLFLTGEVWQAVAGMPHRLFILMVLLFCGLTVVFLATQIGHEAQQLASFERPEDVAQLCRNTPVAPVAPRLARASSRREHLDKAEQLNVVLIVGIAVLTQVAALSLLVGAFFVLFGTVVVSPALVAVWTGQEQPAVLLAFGALGHELAVTSALVRVSGFLAAFTGLYFAVSLIEDATYHREFFDQIVAETRQALAVRVVYRALLNHTGRRSAA